MADQPDRPRIPLVADITSRDSSLAKDAKIINGYVEKRLDGGYDFFKRPGLAVHTELAGGDAVGRGIFNWKGAVYAVWAGVLYKDNVAVAGAVNNNELYFFTSCQGGTPRLFLKNTTNAYVYDDVGGLVAVGDADYPATTVYGAAYLDGTTYVMTPDGSIHGSGLENPESWDPLNKIVAQSEPDAGVAITRHLAYVVAMKEWSTEFFYDAANPTGSPLARIDQLKIPYGSVAARSMAGIEDNLLWASKNRSGGVCVVHLNKGMQAEPISTDPIERILQTANFTTTYAQAFKFAGHRFYVLSLPSSNVSLVFDIDERVWYQWHDAGQTWMGMASSSFLGQEVLLQHHSDGDIYKLDSAVFEDAEHGIPPVELVTPLWDGGTTKVKCATLLEIVGDKTAGNSVQVRHSDDDYQNWVPFRTVDLSLGRARLAGMGSFYRRAHHVKHQLNKSLRLQFMEYQLSLGSI